MFLGPCVGWHLGGPQQGSLPAGYQLLPSLQVVHTGKHVEGQIYLPEVNWALCLLGIAAVAGFRSSVQIGYAFSESHSTCRSRA